MSEGGVDEQCQCYVLGVYCNIVPYNTSLLLNLRQKKEGSFGCRPGLQQYACQRSHYTRRRALTLPHQASGWSLRNLFRLRSWAKKLVVGNRRVDPHSASTTVVDFGMTHSAFLGTFTRILSPLVQLALTHGGRAG
jgi:hypothetical protein